jgi:hypothetical protein
LSRDKNIGIILSRLLATLGKFSLDAGAVADGRAALTAGCNRRAAFSVPGIAARRSTENFAKKFSKLSHSTDSIREID